MAYPHIQLRGVHLERRKQRILENINLEARGGDMLGIMATSGKSYGNFFFFNKIKKVVCITLKIQTHLF
jgi:ABC-type transporter Mla maintaining outer membrane lipid asymmetry ATPase subunit MlaF